MSDHYLLMITPGFWLKLLSGVLSAIIIFGSFFYWIMKGKRMPKKGPWDSALIFLVLILYVLLGMGIDWLLKKIIE